MFIAISGYTKTILGEVTGKDATSTIFWVGVYQLMIQILMAGLLLWAQPVDLKNTLTLTYQGDTIDVVNRTDFSIPIPGLPIIDGKKYQQFVNKLNHQIFQTPINAKINDQGNIVPEQVGYKLNRKAFRKQFYTYFFGEGPFKVEVPELVIHPNVDSELLAHIRVQRLSQYVTYFDPAKKGRSHNISLAAKAIDDHVVFPGETFSFNKVVGKRTEEKGYMHAPIIIKGELSEDIGGGICQVSSTLFNAVDKAGLQIVKRYSHSKRVPYVPPGRDATVSWYGPDFRFRNPYNQPILIQINANQGRLLVKLFSSDVINYPSKKTSNSSSKKVEFGCPS